MVAAIDEAKVASQVQVTDGRSVDPVEDVPKNNLETIAIEEAEVASQAQLTDIESIGTTFDGELDPVLVVTEDDLESKVDTSPAAEAANEKWEQHYKLCFF